MLRDYFNFALGTISHRKLRSWLTMIGIFIGIAAVVALISLGQGFKQAINKEFEKIGTDKLFITAKSGFGAPGTNAAVELVEDDMDVVKRTPGIENIAGYLMVNSKVEFEDEVGFFLVLGMPEGDERRLMQETYNIKIQEGRDLRDSDEFSALITNGYAEKKLLGKNLKLRDKIEVSGKEFTIVGVIPKTGDPEFDRALVLPLDAVREISNEAERIDVILVKVVNVNSISSIAERIKSDLRRARDVKKDEEDFDIQTPEQLLGSFNDILDIVQAVLIGIAAISLLVGGVGIANTMYTAVVERTKEIGIMKSIGAQNRDILLIFLMESGLLGLIGGIIGVVLGFGLSFTVEFIAKSALGINLVEAYFSYSLLFGALAFSFLIGATFGILPARQASLMRPVQALRSK
ncbi:ABC transporter permease [Candidatus Woesearchaeota archaeon]|nr:ABC transporter permease [Candidatus Woesearchaeota archaeon]MBI2660923.1 ABC transporter permease [Candidatus Woesearchaeota archaeon]